MCGEGRRRGRGLSPQLGAYRDMEAVLWWRFSNHSQSLYLEISRSQSTVACAGNV